MTSPAVSPTALRCFRRGADRIRWKRSPEDRCRMVTIQDPGRVVAGSTGGADRGQRLTLPPSRCLAGLTRSAGCAVGCAACAERREAGCSSNRWRPGVPRRLLVACLSTRRRWGSAPPTTAPQVGLLRPGLAVRPLTRNVTAGEQMLIRIGGLVRLGLAWRRHRRARRAADPLLSPDPERAWARATLAYYNRVGDP